MFPFFGFRNMQKNQANLSKALAKMNKGELLVEDILDEEDLINEMKSYTYSQLMSFLTAENLMKLMDYILVEPQEDDYKLGHKFPFNACEILCSENVFVIDKFFVDVNRTPGQEEEEKEEEEDKLEEKLDLQAVDDDNINLNDNNSNNKQESGVSDFSGRSSINYESLQSKNKEDLGQMSLEQEHQVIEEVINTIEELVAEKETELEVTNEGNQSNEENLVQNVIYNVNQNDQSKEDNPIDSEEIKLASPSTRSSPYQIAKQNSIEYPVINHLFSLLQTDSDLNYVLAGYFFKFFNHISSFRSTLLLNYLFLHKKPFIELMIKHLNRKSIADCILKLMCSYSPDLQDTPVKKDTINLILDSLYNEDEEKSENVFEMISEMLQNRRIYYLIAKNRDVLEKIFQHLKDNLKNNQIALFKILIKFVEQVIKDVVPNNKENANKENDFNQEEEDQCLSFKRVNSDSKFHVELDLKNYLDIFEVIYEYLDPFCADFMLTNNSLFNSTYDKEEKCLGLVKLYQIEYIKTILELVINIMSNGTLLNIEIIANSIDRLLDKIITTQIFGQIINFFFEYEMNNFYQNMFEKLLTIVLNKNMSEKLIRHVFVENKLAGLIMEKMFDSGLVFKTGTSVLPGYFAVMCDVAMLINSSENEFVMSVLNESKINYNNLDDEWKYLFKILIQPVKNRFTKGLLYNNQLESPFQKFNSGNKDCEEIVSFERQLPIKVFISEFCLKKFENFKEKKENVLKEGGFFDVERYIKEEEIIKLDDTNLAVSINMEDLPEPKNLESIDLPEISEDSDRDFSSDQIYNDNQFWRNSKVEMEVDISEL